jgi:hypothetical protein
VLHEIRAGYIRFGQLKLVAIISSFDFRVCAT